MEEKEGSCISLQQLEDARRRLSRVPTISSSGKQMAVWSDVKEALFLWCSGPACFSMLIALKHLLGYPATDSGMHPCTQLEQLMFMKLFTAVTPGTLLVDINKIKTNRDLTLLNELLKIRHCNTKDPTIHNCNEMRTTQATDYHTEVPSNGVTNKIFLPSIRREAHKPKVREKETWSVFSKDGKMRFRRSNARQTRSSNSLTEGPPMSAIEETPYQVQEAVAKEELVPLCLLRDSFPVCQSYLDQVMQAYVLGRCTDHMASISKCTVEEARQITQFLASHKGFEVPWLCVTSCSVMLSWSDFYVGYSSRPGALNLLPVPAEHNATVTLSCQDTRGANPDNVAASRNHQRQKPRHSSKPSFIPLLQRESKGSIHKELQNMLKPKATTAESTGDNTPVEGLIKSHEVERQKALNHGHITDVESQNSKKTLQTQTTCVTDYTKLDEEVNSSDNKYSNEFLADTRFNTSEKCNDLTEKATRYKDTSLKKDNSQETKPLKGPSSRSCARVTRSSVNISCCDSDSVGDTRGKSKKIIVNGHSKGNSKFTERSLKDDATVSAFKESVCKRELRETVSDVNLVNMQSTSQKYSKCKDIISDFENSETQYESKSFEKMREENVARGRRNISEEFESSENEKINEIENEEEDEEEGILDSFDTHGIEVSITPKKKMNFSQENDQGFETVETENQTPAITPGLNKINKGNRSPNYTDKKVLKVSSAKINENLPLKLRVKKPNSGKQGKVIYFANYRDLQSGNVQESDNKAQETNKKSQETDNNNRKESSRDEYTPPRYVSLMPKTYEIKTPKSQPKPQTPTEKSPYKATKSKSETHQNGSSGTPHQGNVQSINNTKMTKTDASHPLLHGSPMYVIGRLARQTPDVSVSISLPGPLNPGSSKPRSVSASMRLPDKIVSNLKEQASKSFCATRGNKTVKALEKELQIEGNDMKITDFQSERMTMWQDEMKPTGKDIGQGRLCKSADMIRRKEKGYTYIPTSNFYSHTSDGSNEKDQKPLFRTTLCAVYTRPRSQSPLKTDTVNDESRVNVTKGTTRLSASATKISKTQVSTNITAVCPNYGSSSSKSPDIYDEFARRRRPKVRTSPMKTKFIGQSVARPAQVPQCKTNVVSQPEKPVVTLSNPTAVTFSNPTAVTLSDPTASSILLTESTAQRQSQDQVSQGEVTFQQKYSHATASTPLNMPYASHVHNYTEPSDTRFQARHPPCIMCNHSQEQTVRRVESSSKEDSEKNESTGMCLLDKVGSFADNVVAPKQSDSLESIDNLKSIMNMNLTAELSEVIKRGRSSIEEVSTTNCYPFKHTKHVAKSLQESFQPYIVDTSDNLQTDTGEKIARIDSQLYFGVPGENELFKVAGDVRIPANAQFYMQTSPGEYTKAMSSTPSSSDIGEGRSQVFLKKLQRLREKTEQQNECTATKTPQEYVNNDNSSQSTAADEEGIVSAYRKLESLIKQTPLEVDSFRCITSSSGKSKYKASKPEKNFQDFVEEKRAARKNSDEEARQKKSLASSQVQYLKDSGNGCPKKTGKQTTITGPNCPATSRKPKGSVSRPALPGKPRPKTTPHIRNKSKVQDQRLRPKTTSSLNTNNVSEIDETVPKTLLIEHDIEEKKTRSKQDCSKPRNTKCIGRPKTSQSGPQIKRTISSRLSKSARQSKEVIDKQRNRETRNSCEDTYQVVSALRRLSLDGSFGISSMKAEARKTKLRSFLKAELKSPTCSPNSAASLMQNPSDALQNVSNSDHVMIQGLSISRNGQASCRNEHKYGRYRERISHKGFHLKNDVVKDNENEAIANTPELQSRNDNSYQNSLTKKTDPSYVKGNTKAAVNYSNREIANDSETIGITCDSYMCYLNSNENNGLSEESYLTGKEYGNLPPTKYASPRANDQCENTAIPVVISPCISVENSSRFEFCEVPYTFFNNASTNQQDSGCNEFQDHVSETVDSSVVVHEDSVEIQEASESIDGQGNTCSIISIVNTLDTNGEICLNLTVPDGSVYKISHEDPSYLSLVKFYEDQKLANAIKREQIHEMLLDRNKSNIQNIQEYSNAAKSAEEFINETSDKVFLTEISPLNVFCNNTELRIDATHENWERCTNVSADCMWNSDAFPPHLVKEEPLQYEDNGSCDTPDIEQQNECTFDTTLTASPASYDTVNVLDQDEGLKECENGCHHLPSVEIDVDEYVDPAYYEEQEIVTAPVEDGHEYEHCQYEKADFVSDSIDNVNEVTIVAESDQTAKGSLTGVSDELLNKSDSPGDTERNKHDSVYHPKRENLTLPPDDKTSRCGVSDSPEAVAHKKDCAYLGVDIRSETEVSKQTKSNTSIEKLKQCLMKTCNKMTENTPLFSGEGHSEKVNEKGSESVKTVDSYSDVNSVTESVKAVDSYSDVNSVTDSELDYEADDDERDEDYVPEDSDEKAVSDEEDIGDIYDDVRKINQSLGKHETPKRAYRSKKKTFNQSKSEIEKIYPCKGKSIKKTNTKKKAAVGNRKTKPRQRVASESENNGGYSLDERAGISESGNDTDCYSIKERCLLKTSESEPCIREKLLVTETKQAESSEKKKRAKSKSRQTRKYNKHKDNMDENDSSREEGKLAEGFIKTQKIYLDIIKNNLNRPKIEPRLEDGEKGLEVVREVPCGIPLHGDRVVTKAIAEAEKAREGTGSLSDDHEPDVIEDLTNSCKYQLVEDEDHINLGGVAYFRSFSLPFVYINGYKYIPLRDALTLFQPGHCVSCCTIPRSVLQKSKQLVRTFTTWDQVYKFELIKMKKGPSIKTGDVVVKLDSLLNALPRLVTEIVHLHYNTKLKRSQKCDIDSYRNFNSVNKKKC